jgi:hypothetical protein
MQEVVVGREVSRGGTVGVSVGNPLKSGYRRPSESIAEVSWVQICEGPVRWPSVGYRRLECVVMRSR